MFTDFYTSYILIKIISLKHPRGAMWPNSWNLCFDALGHRFDWLVGNKIFFFRVIRSLM